MERRHSPGPWAAVFDAGRGWQVRNATGGLVAELGHDTSESGGRTERDAHAAAAVPVLLDAARTAEAIFARQGWTPDSTDPEAVALRKLRDAIAKATSDRPWLAKTIFQPLEESHGA